MTEKSFTIWRFTELWLVSVGPQTPFTMKRGKKIIPNSRGEKQIETIAHLPDFPTLLACCLLSFFHGSVHQVFLDLFIHLARCGQWGVLCSNHTNNWLLALSSWFLHFSIVYPDCLHWLSRLCVRLETRPSGNDGNDSYSSFGLARIQLFLTKAQVAAAIQRIISISTW